MGFEDKKSKIKQALTSNTIASTSINNSDDTAENKPLKDLLNNKKDKNNSRPKQTNVYLDEKVRTVLDDLGAAIGKENGGKSRIVNDALIMYFKQNDLMD